MTQTSGHRLHELRELQSWFLEITTHPGSALEGVVSQSQRLALRDITNVVRPGPSETAVERLDIYQQGYFARLTECLADDYPAVSYALGEVVFEDLCQQYIVTHPSKGPSLNGFGRSLPAFATSFKLEQSAFVAELAALEWALVESLHAADCGAPLASMLTAVQPHELPMLRFVTSDALRLLDFEYPINAYLQAFYDDAKPSIPERAPSHTAVVRQGTVLWRFDLQATQAALLARLSQGQPLGHALSGLPMNPTDLQQWFSEWTQQGFFASVLRS